MRNGKSALIIGGDAGEWTGYRACLRSAGIDLVAVGADGREAVSCLSRLGAGFVILDLGPAPDAGEKLLEDIRTGFPGTPVIVLAGSHDPELQDRCLAAGASGYLFKPVQPGRLAATAIWALEQAGTSGNEGKG